MPPYIYEISPALTASYSDTRTEGVIGVSRGHAKSIIKTVFTPHAQCERGKVFGVGVHIIYICIYNRYMFVDQNNLNRTLAIDSPFQTFMVGLLVKFID